MKLTPALIGMTLLASSQAYAEQPNYGFNASDIDDPVFKEKCTAYFDALANSDRDTIMSFISPELKQQYPKELPKEIDRRIDEQMKILTRYPNINLKSIKISKSESNFNSTKNKEGNVVVNFTYQATSKGTILQSCNFKKIKNEKWKYSFIGR